MTEQHLITPPPELLKQWEFMPRSVAFEAAYRAGADHELEACVECLIANSNPKWAVVLQEARRPNPPSLAEEALEAMRSMQIEPYIINGITINAELISKYALIRRALERLQELEANNG